MGEKFEQMGNVVEGAGIVEAADSSAIESAFNALQESGGTHFDFDPEELDGLRDFASEVGADIKALAIPGLAFLGVLYGVHMMTERIGLTTKTPRKKKAA